MAEEAVVQGTEPEKKKKEGLDLIIDRATYGVAVLMGIYHLVAANFTIFQAGQHIAGLLFLVRPARTFSNRCKSVTRPIAGSV